MRVRVVPHDAGCQHDTVVMHGDTLVVCADLLDGAAGMSESTVARLRADLERARRVERHVRIAPDDLQALLDVADAARAYLNAEDTTVPPPARSETSAERRVRELADDIRLVLVPRILALTDAAARAGDRERLKRIQTSLATRIGKETGA